MAVLLHIRSTPDASQAQHDAFREGQESRLHHDPCLLLVVSSPQSRYTDSLMSNPTQPNIQLTNTPDYRETYANSVQVRVNVWDFFLVFGTLQQQSETQVEVNNFQGIYLSPQQAKALSGILQQNVAGYESTFGEIKLDPRMMAPGPVH